MVSPPYQPVRRALNEASNITINTISNIADSVGIEDSGGTQVDPATSTNQIPSAVASVFQSSVNADTDILGSDVSPSNNPSAFRITVSLASSAVFNAQVTRSGNTVEEDLNDSNALSAGSVYSFYLPIRSSDSVNFQVETGVTINRLDIEEVQQSSV